MARFKLVDGDVEILMRAYNALAAGEGTHMNLPPLPDFLQAWRSAGGAFACDDGFVGVIRADTGQGELVMAGPLTLGPLAAALLRELVPAYQLVCLRTITTTPAGDELCEAAGLHYDGLVRAFIQNGAGWKDTAFWSLLPADLQQGDTAAEKG